LAPIREKPKKRKAARKSERALRTEVLNKRVRAKISAS